MMQAKLNGIRNVEGENPLGKGSEGLGSIAREHWGNHRSQGSGLQDLSVQREQRDLKHLVRAQSRTIGANMATMGLPEAEGEDRWASTRVELSRSAVPATSPRPET